MISFRKPINDLHESLSTAKALFAKHTPRERRDDGGNVYTSETLFAKLSEIDATPSKKFLEWIVRQYIALDTEKQETDALSVTQFSDRMKKMITDFNRLSGRLEQKNILSYTLVDLEQALSKVDRDRDADLLNLKNVVEGRDYIKVAEDGNGSYVFAILNHNPGAKKLAGCDVGRVVVYDNRAGRDILKTTC